MKRINNFELLNHMFERLQLYVIGFNQTSKPLRAGRVSTKSLIISNVSTVFCNCVDSLFAEFDMLEHHFRSSFEVDANKKRIPCADLKCETKLSFEELVCLISLVCSNLKSILEDLRENGLVDADKAESPIVDSWFEVTISQIDNIDNLAFFIEQTIINGVKNNGNNDSITEDAGKSKSQA